MQSPSHIFGIPALPSQFVPVQHGPTMLFMPSSSDGQPEPRRIWAADRAAIALASAAASTARGAIALAPGHTR